MSTLVAAVTTATGTRRVISGIKAVMRTLTSHTQILMAAKPSHFSFLASRTPGLMTLVPLTASIPAAKARTAARAVGMLDQRTAFRPTSQISGTAIPEQTHGTVQGVGQGGAPGGRARTTWHRLRQCLEPGTQCPLGVILLLRQQQVERSTMRKVTLCQVGAGEVPR